MLGALAGLLTFLLDATLDLPISTIGLVFALGLVQDFWRATRFLKERSFTLYPEKLFVAILILMLSLLPLSGLAWWEIIGMRSQVLGMLFIIGILMVLAGIWGHFRIIRALPVGEAKPDDNTL